MKQVFETRTAVGHYKIVDQTYNDRPARILYAGRSTPQSGLALDEEPELLFDYVQRLFEIVLSTAPKSVLVIGGGAFTLPRAILERTAVQRLDVVEIDKDLPELARSYFGLPGDDTRLTIFSEDGAEYLKRTRQKYDLIIIDAFSEYDIPMTLMNAQAAKLYRDRLTENGVLAMNFIGYYQGMRAHPTRTLIETIRTVLPVVQLYLADVDDDKYDEQNLLLTATRYTQPYFPYLHSESVHEQL